MGQERKNPGQDAKTVTIDRIRQIFTTVTSPTVSSADIGLEFGVTAEVARQKLDEFHNHGILGKRKTARLDIYWFQSPRDVKDINPEDPVWV